VWLLFQALWSLLTLGRGGLSGRRTPVARLSNR